MKQPLQFLAFCFVAVSTHVLAAPYESDLLRLDVPGGLEGPLKQQPGPGVMIVSYTKPYPDGTGGTLLRITTFELPPAARELTDPQLST
jgi:hypothetical protein